MGVALDSTTGSSQDTQEGRHGHREEATWRRRQRREGGTQTDKADGLCTTLMTAGGSSRLCGLDSVSWA